MAKPITHTPSAAFVTRSLVERLFVVPCRLTTSFRVTFLLLTSSLLFVLTIPGTACAGPVHLYEVKVSAKRPAVVKVRLTLAEVGESTIRLAWLGDEKRAGQNASAFARSLSAFQVTNNRGKPIPFERAGSRYWTVRPQGAQTVLVTYEVAQWVPRKDKRQAILFDPADSLVYWVGHESDPARIRYYVPKGWKVACSLKVAKSPLLFEASSVRRLFDSPALVGRINRTDFKIKGVPFALVFQQRPSFDAHAVALRLKKIAQYQFDLFGTKPFDRYAFLVVLHEEMQPCSGSERASSSVYSLPQRMFDTANCRKKDAGPFATRDLDLLFARQLFKAWNSRFIHPRSLEDSKEGMLGRPAHTRARWFIQGVSEYYAHRSLLKTGLTDEAGFFSAAGTHLRKVESNGEYGRTSVARASGEASTSGYRANPNQLSVTSAGFLLGLVLDLEILEATRGRRSLDDVMKFLGWWFGKKKTGYDDNRDLEKAVSTVAEHDFSDFFRRYVEGTSRVPIAETMTRIGYAVDRRQQTTPCRYQFIRHLSRAGLQTQSGKIRSLTEDNCLHAAGLREGDRIVSILGVQVKDHADLDALARAFFAKWRKHVGPDDRSGDGTGVPVTFRRNGRVMKTKVALPSFCQMTVTITPKSGRKVGRPAYVKKWLAAK